MSWCRVIHIRELTLSYSPACVYQRVRIHLHLVMKHAEPDVPYASFQAIEYGGRFFVNPGSATGAWTGLHNG
jgi:hypothetical protein